MLGSGSTSRQTFFIYALDHNGTEISELIIGIRGIGKQQVMKSPSWMTGLITRWKVNDQVNY
jgi:hypothetical protein